MIEIPSELVQVVEDVILTLDGMTVNSLAFLTAISIILKIHALITTR